MTPRNFFVGRAVVVSILLVLGLAIFLFKTYVLTDTPALTPVPSTNSHENSAPPVFAWKYEEDTSLNPDGNPQTVIFLEALYPDGTIQSKHIDTTPSSCNEVPDAEMGSVPNSTNIQCYGAGLGYRFKITHGETAYRVERIMFEESTPDYTPPVSEYEVVSEFPFTR